MGGRLRAHELRRRKLLEEQLVLVRVRIGVGVGVRVRVGFGVRA